MADARSLWPWKAASTQRDLGLMPFLRRLGFRGLTFA